MNPEELKQLMHEVLDERNYICEQRGKSKLTKKQMIMPNILAGVSVFVFLATWIIAVYSWFTNGTFPYELVGYTSVLFGLVCCACCGKAAYEYKADKDNESKQNKFP